MVPSTPQFFLPKPAMKQRSEALQSFIDAAGLAFDTFAQDAHSRRAIHQIFAALQTMGAERTSVGRRLPVCSHLDGAPSVKTAHESLRRLVDRFSAIEALLEWRRRSVYDSSASANFVDGHANAMIIGPNGVEEREDIWLGATLMAPNVRYPDHAHAPEEVYLVLSKGEFRQDDGVWFSPGIGGSFYNEPNIKHAMRSVETPLFALWVLLPRAVPQGAPRRCRIDLDRTAWKDFITRMLVRIQLSGNMAHDDLVCPPSVPACDHPPHRLALSPFHAQLSRRPRSACQDLLVERALKIPYETVRRWILKLGPLFASELGR